MRRFVFLLLVLAAPALAAAQERPLCHDWTECRDFALRALADRDYESFHDFARRSLAAGPPRDAKLMYLLARAQSLSGRADDALQMLGRLAQMGVATDATTSVEFDAVRGAPGWVDLKTTLDRLKPRLRLGSGAAASAAVAPTAPVASTSAPGGSTVDKPAILPSPASAAVAATADKAVAPGSSETALRLPATRIIPTGLAYDHVSGRFLFADRDNRKLVSVDELSRHMVDLVKADSAGFETITAFEIDPRRGDLWVVSAADGAAPPGRATVLHKLQLVSGRPLAHFQVDAQYGAARFDDVAVSEGGVVFALDGEGGRIFRLPPHATALALAVQLRVEHPVSLTLTSDRRALVACREGVVRVDLVSGVVTRVSASKAIALGGLERIRWDHGHLVATQRGSDGVPHVISIAVAGGIAPRATKLQRLDSADAVAGGTLTAISGEDVYFLTREEGHAGEDGEFVVHRARIH